MYKKVDKIMSKLKIEDILDAYRKFKSHVYYDSHSYYLKKLVTEFESSENLNERMNILLQKLNNFKDDKNIEHFKQYLTAISYYLLPKTFVSPLGEGTNGIITSSSSSRNNYLVSSYTILINAPIEIHIISVLWILKQGACLYTGYNSYAFDLVFKDKKTKTIKEGNKLFRPYYEQYKSWKDNAFNAVKKIVDVNSNAVLVSLDIKNFYHSVDLSHEKLREAISKYKKQDRYLYLSILLEKIHNKYSDTIKEHLDNPNAKILPIGLLSSGILANWYLNQFDQNIINSMNPEYYGRYADDILIVLRRNTKYISDLKKSGEQFLLLHKELFTEGKVNIENFTKEYHIKEYPYLNVQTQKLKIFIFDRNTSAPLLKKIEKVLRDNSSEFRMLPDETIMKNEVDDYIFNVSFSDNDNKLRNISKITIDKFGLSRYLSQKIYMSKFLNGEIIDLDETMSSIIELFKGELGLELYSLWEKLFTYLILLNQKEKVISLFQGINKSIYKISDIRENSSHQKTVIQSMRMSLQVAVATNLYLNPSFSQNTDITKALKENVLTIAKNFRETNMFRHHLINFPLLNYTEYAIQGENLLEENIKLILDKKLYSIDLESNLVKFSPRYIAIHEASLYVSYKKMGLEESDPSLSEAFKIYYDLNFKYRSYYKSEEFKQSLSSSLFTEESPVEENGKIIITKTIINSDKKKKDKLFVALANISVHNSDIINNLLNKANLSYERLNNLFKILNMFSSEKCELIVLPEISIPVSWLPLLVKYSIMVKKAIIFGMEHLIINNTVYNYQITILPTISNGYPSCIVKPRLKNHYSPEEARIIEGYRFVIPKVFTMHYDLFIWNGVHFSCFNCYELTNISHRAEFKSKVDLLVVTEDNRDVNYFSNLAESVARDLHCFFIQVNNALYGDSRITQPSKTETKNIVQLRGGENSTILIGELDLKALRHFQIKEYELQKEDKTFKPTPPDFDKDLVLRRL